MLRAAGSGTQFNTGIVGFMVADFGDERERREAGRFRGCLSVATTANRRDGARGLHWEELNSCYWEQVTDRQSLRPTGREEDTKHRSRFPVGSGALLEPIRLFLQLGSETVAPSPYSAMSSTY